MFIQACDYNRMKQIQGESSSEVKALNRYKNRLLLEVILLLVFCLLIIFQRILYPIILHSEQQILPQLQSAVGLVSAPTTPTAISDIFFTLWGRLSEFNIQFLFVTHSLLTIYLLMDWAIAAKIGVVTLAIIQVVTFLQLIYKGSRPAWTSSSIFESWCLQGYGHPNLGCILLVVIPAYTYYCWRNRFKDLIYSYRNKCNVFGILALIFSIFLIQFLNYATGNVFLINIALSGLCCIFLFILLSFLDSRIDSALKGLTEKANFKGLQVKWIFFILISVLFLQMTYSAASSFQNMQWIHNHLACKQYLSQTFSFISYDKIIGPWFNFKQSATTSAWIALVLAFPICQLTMKSRSWNQGSAKQQALNVMIGNLMLLPSWLFQVLVKEEGWIRDIGANSFIIDSIHYFLLYLWLFGLMPPLLLSRLKTVEQLDYTLPHSATQ